MARTSKRTGAFISYSQHDEEWMKALGVHLEALEQTTGISFWSRSKIEAGQDRAIEVRDAIEHAQVAICLVSARFCSSNHIQKYELPALLEAYERDGVKILPVFVSPCLVPDALLKLQGVNKPGRTLVDMTEAERERVFASVAGEVRRLATPDSMTTTPRQPAPVTASFAQSTRARQQTPRAARSRSRRARSLRLRSRRRRCCPSAGRVPPADRAA